MVDRRFELVKVIVDDRVYGPLMRYSADSLVQDLALQGAMKVEVTSVK